MEIGEFWSSFVPVVMVAANADIEGSVGAAESVFGKIFEAHHSEYYGGCYFIGEYRGCEVFIRINFELDAAYDGRAPFSSVILHSDIDAASEIKVANLIKRLEAVGFTYLEKET